MKRLKATQVFSFLGGIYFLLYFILPENLLTKIGVSQAHSSITKGFIIIGTMAFGVGIINLIQIHLGKIARSDSSSFYSYILLITLGSTFFFGIIDWQFDREVIRQNSIKSAYILYFESKKSQITQVERENLRRYTPYCFEKLGNNQEVLDCLKKTDLSTIEKYSTNLNNFSTNISKILHDGFFVPLGSSMFALLAFYVASAAFRAFRVRSLDASLLMLSALIVVLGQTSIGVSVWSGFPAMRNWLLAIPNSAAFRGISLGASIAGLILSIRIWLSLDEEDV